MRTTPLEPGGPLARRTALTATTPLHRSQTAVSRPNTVPVPRRKAPAYTGALWSSESRAKRIVRERAEGRCEMGCGMPGHDWSHRRSRAQGGPWHPANGALACRRCHRACEVDAPILADLGGWRIVHRDPDLTTAPVYLQAWGDRSAGWYLLTETTVVIPAPWAPAPLWFPWMPRPR
jgi:hypothetical protein